MNRAFKGVWIPKEIWLSENLTLQEKVFLVEIDSLDNEDGCFASNKHFSKFFGLSKGRVSQVISQLNEKGFISITYKHNEDKSIDKRVIRVVNKLNTPIKFPKHPYLGNAKESNTSTSNTFIKEIVEIINYLNDVADKKYKHSTQKTQKHISARFNDGFSVEDFKKVIDIKTAEWKNDKNMNKYLRPETLFGTKFEGYLNQDVSKSKGEINLDDFDLDD